MAEKDNPEVALAQLVAATERYAATAAAHEQAREQAIAAVVAALNAGVSPTRVKDVGPFTDAYVRKVAREHGVAPAKPGIKPGMRSSKKVAGGKAE